jgi:hypothetical protein
MWRMPDGDRVLTEAEWVLFCAGLEPLLYALEEDMSAQTDNAQAGVPVFDRLTPEQKLAVLAEAAQALRDPAVPTPPLTAVNEGAIMAVFVTIRDELQAELDLAKLSPDDPPTYMRQSLRAVCEGTEDREEPLPDLSCTDMDPWDWLLQEVEDRVFWDYDFDMEDEFLDSPPEEARGQLQIMGIDPDYYLTVPAEPDKVGLLAARQTLARLLGRSVPDDE